jgi:lipopolysaccharide exporter
MSMKHGLVRGALSLGGVRIFTNLLNAATLLILARLLTPQDFGVVAIASAVLHVVISLTQVSIFQALMQRASVSQEHIDTAWTLAFIRTCLILAFFLLAAWPLSLVYNDPRMMPVFIVSGLSGAFQGLFNPHMNLATKEMRFGPLTIFQFCQKGPGLVVTIVLALMFQSFWAIIIGNLVGAVLSSLLSYVLIPYRPRFTLKHWRDFLGFSGWMFLNQLCETLNWRFSQLMISVMLPKAQMGLYAMADSFAVIPSRETVQPLREALFPGLAAMNGDRVRMARSCMRAQTTIALIAAPLGIGLALVADPAVRVMLGDKWLEAVPYVQILTVTYALGSLTSLFSPTAMALGETRLNFLMQFWGIVTRIPLVVAGLVFGGLFGAALAGLASEVVSVLVSLLYMKRLLKISIWQQIAPHGSTLASLAVMCAAVLLGQRFIDPVTANELVRLIVLSSLGGAVYVLTALAIWQAGGRLGGPVSEIINIAMRFMPSGRKQADANT